MRSRSRCRRARRPQSASGGCCALRSVFAAVKGRAPRRRGRARQDDRGGARDRPALGRAQAAHPADRAWPRCASNGCQELFDKFSLPSSILESRSYNEVRRTGATLPFFQDGRIVMPRLKLHSAGNGASSSLTRRTACATSTGGTAPNAPRPCAMQPGPSSSCHRRQRRCKNSLRGVLKRRLVL